MAVGRVGIADGLADPSVVVLDPCCGTGAYLVEVLRTIDRTLTAKGADALTRNDVKRAARRLLKADDMIITVVGKPKNLAGRG